MPLNPCGYAVEMLRVGYTTRMRFFRDDQEHTGVMRWYPCAPDAPTLPFPTCYVSSVWCTFPERKTSPGETYPPAFRTRRFPVIPDVPQGHVCGTREEFARGAEYDPDRPATVYDQDGLPVCCRDGGGVELGGEAPAFGDVGGVELGGEYPPGVVPGATCATAGELALGEVGSSTIGPGPVQQWWVIPVSGSTLYHVELDGGIPPATFKVNVFRGTSCGTLALDQIITLPGCYEFTTGAGDTFVWLMVDTVDGPYSYAVSVAAGAC